MIESSAIAVKTLAVVGAGAMGAGIAQTAASAGLSVIMTDVDEDAVARGGATIAASLDRFVKKGTLSAADAAAIATADDRHDRFRRAARRRSGDRGGVRG